MTKSTQLTQSLQDQFAPHNACFGCGPSNAQGLQIKSRVGEAGQIVATWQPQKHHEAFPGILSGGIIGTLLDCHSNWSAAYFLMQASEQPTPPCCVTAYYNVKLLAPTPSDKPVNLVAVVKEIYPNKALITAELFSGEQLCASSEGLFVAVKPGHPAYHRW